jgi:acetyl-CoA carboxylase biotin carboxyl carrier protein
MNLKEIKEIINLMNEHNLSEIEVDKGDQKIKLKKSPSPGAGVVIEQPALSMPVQQIPEQVTEKPEPEKKPSNLIEIKAPIVGTFYNAPSPDAEPFVEAGQEIEVGHVVCIIEAMKLMNEIKSEVRGKIIDILVENADPIEFGQILFLIEPS